MAGNFVEIFNDLIGLSGKFVEMKHGRWDHNAWINFMSNIQEKGIDLKSDMLSALGQVLESVRDVYTSSMATKGMEKTMLDMTDITATFVINTKGVWDHSQWERYMNDIKKIGIDMTFESQKYMGDLLESSKKLYEVLPSSVKKDSD